MYQFNSAENEIRNISGAGANCLPCARRAGNISAETGAPIHAETDTRGIVYTYIANCNINIPLYRTHITQIDGNIKMHKDRKTDTDRLTACRVYRQIVSQTDRQTAEREGRQPDTCTHTFCIPTRQFLNNILCLCYLLVCSVINARLLRTRSSRARLCSGILDFTAVRDNDTLYRAARQRYTSAGFSSIALQEHGAISRHARSRPPAPSTPHTSDRNRKNRKVTSHESRV